MDKMGVYERIKKIADDLTQSKTVFDRADLTSELHEFGVLSDSLEVSDLVWDAYVYYNRNSNIREAFMNNARDAYLVDEYEVLHLLEESDGKALFQYLGNRLEKGGRSLNFFNITDMSGLHYFSADAVDFEYHGNQRGSRCEGGGKTYF